MFDELIRAAGEFGPTGLALALVVLVLVYAARLGGLVVDGKWARIANIVLSAVLAGLNPLDPAATETLVAVIASIASALIYEALKYAGEKVGK